MTPNFTVGEKQYCQAAEKTYETKLKSHERRSFEHPPLGITSSGRRPACD